MHSFKHEHILHIHQHWFRESVNEKQRLSDANASIYFCFRLFCYCTSLFTLAVSLKRQQPCPYVWDNKQSFLLYVVYCCAIEVDAMGNAFNKSATNASVSLIVKERASQREKNNENLYYDVSARFKNEEGKKYSGKKRCTRAHNRMK